MSTKNNIKKLFDFMAISQKLKETKRWKNVDQMKIKETSADHSWHVAFLAWLFEKEINFGINFCKALQIILIHDLAEAITDDIDYVQFFKGLADPEEKNRNERLAIKKIAEVLPAKSGRIISKLWHEYEDKTSPEGKFAYAMDKIEGLHHMIHTGHKCFHFPEIIGTYPNKAVIGFPALKGVLKEHKKRAKVEMAKHGWEWKLEYELTESDCLPVSAEIIKIFDFIKISEKLKVTKRFLNTTEMIWKESSADHSWHVAILSFIIAEELHLKVDILQSIKIALVHDLVEAIAGDTDHSLIAWGIKSKETKHEEEKEAIEIIRKTLPDKSGREIYDIWMEYEDAKTPEARYIKALDKIEGINHMHCIGTKCFDHPELIAPYPKKTVERYPEIKELYIELHRRIKPQFAELGWEWKEDYDLNMKG